MKILEDSYAGILKKLTTETLKQLLEFDDQSPKIEPEVGVAQVHVGRGVYLTIKIDITITTPQMMIQLNKS